MDMTMTSCHSVQVQRPFQPCNDLLSAFLLPFADGSRDLQEGTSPSSTVTTNQAVPNITGTIRSPTKGAQCLMPQGGPPTTATAKTGAGTTAI